MKIGSLNISFREFLGKKIDTAKIVSANYGVQASYKMLAIHIAASYIANALSKCEFKVYEEGKKVKNETWYKLNVSPNRNQNGSQFWNKVFMKMLTDPNGALVIVTNGQLYVADSFEIDMHPFTGHIFTSIVVDQLSIFKSYHADEVFWLRLEDENVVKFINGMYEDYGKAISYAMKSFLKKNSQKYKLKVAADKIGDKTFNEYYEETLKDQLKNFISAENAVYPERRGYSLEEFKNESKTKDSAEDVLNLRKDIFQVAGQAYKIPQAMMDGNINNIEDVVSAFLTFAVEPVAHVPDDEINRKMFGHEKIKAGSYVKIDTSQIPYVSILKNATGASSLIANTICQPEEIRELFRLDDKDEEILKTFFVTKNNSKAEDVLNGTVQDGKE